VISILGVTNIEDSPVAIIMDGILKATNVSAPMGQPRNQLYHARFYRKNCNAVSIAPAHQASLSATAVILDADPKNPPG